MRESGAAATLGETETEWPTFIMPSNNFSDLYARGGAYDNASPSPVPLFSSLLADGESVADSKVFWNSLAGVFPSPMPLTNVGDRALFTSTATVMETMASTSGLTVGSAYGQNQSLSGSNAKYKSMMPSRLPISASFAYLTIPPGLSPTTLLDSPMFVNVKLVDESPTTGPLGSALKTELDHQSVFSEGVECKEVRLRQQGSIGSSCMSDIRAAVPKPVSGTSECTSVSASFLGFESNTGQAPAFLQNGSQVYNSVVPATLIASDSDAFTTAQLPDIAPRCLNGRTNIDGYNWKKYGQKQLKGAEFPRSYYKCTHPNCPVKKQVECSLEGEITEIMYKGEHNHQKPQGPRRGGRTGAKLFLLDNDVEAASAVCKQESDRLSADLSSSSVAGLAGTPEQSFGSPSVDEHDDFEQVKSENEGEDEQDSKRRKTENHPEMLPKAPFRTRREHRVVVQTTSKVDILDDGYRWRKYGQKIVKGKHFPRSYYKCTNVGCAVRKHVERSSTDPTSVMTAYEGKHNHSVPAARGNVRETIEGANTFSLPLVPYATSGFSTAQRQALPCENEQPGSLVGKSFNRGNQYDDDMAPSVSKMEINGGEAFSFSKTADQSMGLDPRPRNHLDASSNFFQGMHKQGFGLNFSQPSYTATSCITEGN